MDIFSSVNYTYNPHAIPPFAAGILILLIGVFVLSKNTRDLKHILFFLFTLTIAIWQISSFIYHSAINKDIGYIYVRYVLFLGISFIHVLPYHFAVLLLNLEKQKKFAIIGYVIGAIFYILQASGGLIVSGLERTYWGYSGILGPLGIPYIIFFYIYAIALSVNVYLGYKRADTDAERLKLKYLFIGLIVSTVGSVDFIAMSGVKLYQGGFIFVDFLVIVMAYTIVRHRLLDIETVVHKTLLWITTSISIVIPIFILVVLLRYWLETLTSIQQTIFYTVIFFSLLAVYSRLQPRIDHFFNRKIYDAEKLFIKFIKDISQIKGIEDLADKIINTLSDVFYTNNTRIILFDEDYKGCMLVKGIGCPDEVKSCLPEPKLLEWFKGCDDVIEAEQIEIDPRHSDIREPAMKYFDALGSKICIPLVFYDRLLGLIILGKKGNLKPFTVADIKLLSMFRMEAAVALSNSLSFTSLNVLKNSLEDKVRERTEELAESYFELKKEHEKTKEVAKLKSLFIANVSHELRTPLSSVIGFAELLQSRDFGDLNDKQEKYLENIMKNGRHLLQLINDVLDLSKIDAGKMPVAANDFDIADLLNEAVGNILPIAAKKEVKITTEFADDLSHITADYTKVRQIMDNLLSNAVKFTPMGGTINITASLIQPLQKREAFVLQGKDKADLKLDIPVRNNMKYLYVSVEDTGIGIKKEDQRRIFDAFEQVDDSYTKEYQGTGLGLSIVKKFLELQKGKIWLESEIGKGSKFSFIIPEKIPAGLALKKKTFDLYKMLHGIITMISSEIEAKKIKIDFKCEWSFQYKITADKELLRGILINIINNAVSYSPEKAGVIVLLKTTEDKYLISVGNQWNDEYGKITSLFFESIDDDINSKAYIGLPEARMILEAHNGLISARNDMKEKMTWIDISIPM